MDSSPELKSQQHGLGAQDQFSPIGAAQGLGRHAQKLARSVYSGSVTSLLREAIISGRLAEGSPLVERTLAQQLQVSRGPVRNAFYVLEGEGLVTTLANGRMVVAGFDRQDLSDLLAVRLELEGTAVRWAVERGSEVQPVLDVLAKMEAEGTTTQRLVDLDIDFHRALLDLSGSRFLVQAWLALAPVIHTVVTLGNRELKDRDPASNFERIIESHRAIAEPLATSSADEAVCKLAEQFRFTSLMVNHANVAATDPQRKGVADATPTR